MQSVLPPTIHIQGELTVTVPILKAVITNISKLHQLLKSVKVYFQEKIQESMIMTIMWRLPLLIMLSWLPSYVKRYIIESVSDCC